MGVEPTSKSISERLSPSAADCFYFAHPSPTRQTRGFAIPWILLRYREITQEVPACMTPGSRAAGDTGPTRGAELCSQCEIVVCFSVSFERVLFTWITATARLSLFHTPVETFTPPKSDEERQIYPPLPYYISYFFLVNHRKLIRISLQDRLCSCRRTQLYLPQLYP